MHIARSLLLLNRLEHASTTDDPMTHATTTAEENLS